LIVLGALLTQYTE